MSNRLLGVHSTMSDLEAIIAGEPTEHDHLLSLGNTRYGLRALAAEVSELSSRPRGERNSSLNAAACKLGSLIAGGQLDENTVREALHGACEANNLIRDDGRDSFRATLKSGFKKGTQNPRGPIEDGPAPIGSMLNIRRASEIKPERISWLWEGVLAKGAISILAGNPGLGKSQASLSIAATISVGGLWPDGKQRAEVGHVFLLSMEDRAEDTIIPRLRACGADLDRIHVVTTVGDRPFNLDQDIPLVRAAIEGLGSVSLIIIDPISAYLGKSDTNNSGEVRKITTELTALAQEYGASVLMVAHLNKKADQQAAYRVQGSVSWIAAARTAFVIEKDGDDPDRRIMAPAKNNLAPDSTSYAFTVQPREIDGGIKTSLVVWEDASHSNTADEVLSHRGDGGRALNEAKQFVAELLKDGPVPSVVANKATAGIAGTTLWRAKQDLKVHGVCRDGVWYWEYGA